MKAIVAKLLFGGIFGCLGWINSSCAMPIDQKPSSELILKSSFSAKSLFQTAVSTEKSQIFSLFNYVMPIGLNTVKHSLNLQDKQIFSPEKKPYIYETEQTNLALGFQNTFWPSTNNHKYWGITTVENWGKDNAPKLSPSKLNYTDSAPTLAAGSSKLTFSGGGNKDLGTGIDFDGLCRVSLLLFC